MGKRVTEGLACAVAKHNAAYEAAQEATYRLEQAEEAVAEAKAKVADEDAPKLIGRAFRWADPGGQSSDFRAAYLVMALQGDCVAVLQAEQGYINRAGINLKLDRPHELFDQIEQGFLVEIPKAEFEAEYARILALLSTEKGS
jgi:hypothetical protein